MMGKRLLYTLMIYLVGAGALFAQEEVKQANAEYEKDHYDKAIALYEQAAKKYGTSSELYYNIANSYYRLGNMGEAILYYERALKLDPNNDDARFNLEFVKDKANIRVDDGSSFFTDRFADWIYGHSSNVWAVTAATMFVIFVVSLLVYIFFGNVTLRKIGFFGGGLMLVLSVISLTFAISSRNRVKNNRYAIVTVPSSTLSTSPRQPKDKSEEAFLLNEGFKVEIVDSVKNTEDKSGAMWYDVKTEDGHRAWVNASDVKEI